MVNSNSIVGKVLSVSGNTISVQLSDNVKSNSPIIDGVVYKIGQIGSFLKIPLGYCNLYGIVTQIGATAIPSNILKNLSDVNYSELANQQWLTMSLIGEQIGKRFTRGVSQSPTVGDCVHLVTISDLRCVYSDYNRQSSINVGNISISESLEAYLDLDKLVSRHFAVLGSTGSGKSNAVAITLQSIINKKFPRARILVLDPHGEYNEAFQSQSTVFKIRREKEAKELYVPYWALPFNELMALFDASISDANRDYIRSKIVEAKRHGAQANKIEIEDALITADSPIPFSIKQLWFELDDFERQTYNERGNPATKTKLIVEGSADKLISNQYEPASPMNTKPYLNNQAKCILPFLEDVRLKLSDTRYEFLFNPGEFTPGLCGKITSDLDALLNSWIGDDKPITIFDLSDVPSEIMQSIVGSLLNITYDALFWGQNLKNGGKQQPLLVVLEEAHNYLKSDSRSIASRTVQRIAKEGRKYGVGLLLVTQRPSELDETILSQCGTIIALRMNNSKDRSFVSGAIQDELRSLVDLLPSLRVGEAIISGEGVKIPSRVQFYKMSNTSKGSDPLVSSSWSIPLSEGVDTYDKLLYLWRNKKFVLEDNNNE